MGTGASDAMSGASWRCGYGRDHVMVSAEPVYTAFGWTVVLFLGATERPLKVRWRCGGVFDETDDPRVLANFG